MRTTLLVTILVAMLPSTAVARSSYLYAYRYQNVWTAAVRLFRIELGCIVKEKDKEDGYFIFEYRDGDRTFPGSVELIRTRKDQSGVQRGVQVIVQIPEMPSYVERMMLNRLSRKLGTEYGEPIHKDSTRNEQIGDSEPSKGEKAPAADEKKPVKKK